MGLRELLRLVLFNLGRMKLRVAMTATGVVVGTMAIVAMVALGLGLQQSLTTSLLTAVSLNEITVFPGAFSGSGFTPQTQRTRILDEELIERIERIRHVEQVVPVIDVSNVIAKAAGRESRPLFVTGFDPKRPGSLKVEKGALPRTGVLNQVVVGAKLDRAFLREREDPGDIGLDLEGKSLRLTLTRVNDEGETEERGFKVRVTGVAASRGPETDFSTLWAPVGLVEEMAAWEKDDANFVRKTGYDALTVITH